MRRDLFGHIPEMLVPLLTANPAYFLKESRIILGREVANGALHVRMPVMEEARKKSEQGELFRVISRYTPSVEFEKNEVLANMVSLFRMNEPDLAGLLVDCAREITITEPVFVGLHLGAMKTVRNPNGFDYPIFEGENLKVGMIMGDLAERLGVKILATEAVYAAHPDKGMFAYHSEVGLRSGSVLRLYEVQ